MGAPSDMGMPLDKGKVGRSDEAHSLPIAVEGAQSYRERPLLWHIHACKGRM